MIYLHVVVINSYFPKCTSLKFSFVNEDTLYEYDFAPVFTREKCSFFFVSSLITILKICTILGVNLNKYLKDI